MWDKRLKNIVKNNLLFDVIVGNPPYQINLFEKGAINNNQNIPIYHLFVEQTKNKAYNIASYLKNKFTHFLLLQATPSINLSKNTYRFIPIQEFSKSWKDNEFYNLTKEEIEFIEFMIKPMK